MIETLNFKIILTVYCQGYDGKNMVFSWIIGMVADRVYDCFLGIYILAWIGGHRLTVSYNFEYRINKLGWYFRPWAKICSIALKNSRLSSWKIGGLLLVWHQHQSISIGAQFTFDQNIDKIEIYQKNFTTSLYILFLPEGSPPKFVYSHVQLHNLWLWLTSGVIWIEWPLGKKYWSGPLLDWNTWF